MIVVDVETTGINPDKHAIVSIGAVEFEHAHNQFYGECRIEKGVEVDPQAMSVNGMSKADITDPKKPTLAELTQEFDEWVKSVVDITLGGQNVTFDLRMLWGAYRKMPQLRAPFGYRTVEMHTLAYTHMKRRGIKIPTRHNRSNIDTDAIHKYVGLPEEPKPHHALTGAKMEAEALSRLMYGKNLLPDYKKNPIPDYLRAKD